MALDATLLYKNLQARIQELGKRRAEMLTKRTDELQRIQDQIDACQRLVTGWDVLSVADALALIPQTGIDLKIN